jgi:polyisoprenoid-binding protein YceI
MICSMPLGAGSYKVGPDAGKLQVRTYREGMAQKVGHDLVIDVGRWQAVVQASEDATISAVELEADSRSLGVREGLRGVKPLTDKDRAEIRKNIDEKVLRGEPVVFRSSAVESAGGQLMVRGELSLAGTSRPASFELEVTADGHLTGTLPLAQSEWGIKPYRGLIGALRVRDTVEIVVDVHLPLGE